MSERDGIGRIGGRIGPVHESVLQRYREGLAA